MYVREHGLINNNVLSICALSGFFSLQNIYHLIFLIDFDLNQHAIANNRIVKSTCLSLNLSLFLKLFVIYIYYDCF